MAQVLELFQPVEVPSEVLWHACSSPEGLSRWQADGCLRVSEQPEVLRLAWPAVEAEVDLQVESDRAQGRVTFSGQTSVTELVVSGTGVRLRYWAPELSVDYAGVKASWSLALAQLAHSVSCHAGRDRKAHWEVRSVGVEAGPLHDWLTHTALLQRWLIPRSTAGALKPVAVGRRGDAYSLRLRSDHALVGRVLVNSVGADFALTIASHDNAVLAFRSLPGPLPGRRTLALIWSTWGGRQPPALVMVELGGSLDRLVSELEVQGRPRAPGEPLH
jgi:hypothetical protein